MARVGEIRAPEPSKYPVGRLGGPNKQPSSRDENRVGEIHHRGEHRVGILTSWLRPQGGIGLILLDCCLRKTHLIGSEISTHKMAEGEQMQRGVGSGSISPSVLRQAAPTLEGTLGVIAEMQGHHAREMSGMADTLAKMRADFAAEIEQLTQQGKRYDQQYAPAHIQVKLVGDVHRTLRNICRAPELSQANLADFDQWAEEIIHTIDAARTNTSDYNKVNIEFIYGSIDLDLRSQAEGHVPEKMNLIHMMTPLQYLELLAKLYTPADHLSTKRGRIRGEETTVHGIAHGLSRGHVPPVQQSQIQ